jgi:hypothetical protein
MHLFGRLRALPVHISDDLLPGKRRVVNRCRPNRERLSIKLVVADLFGSDPTRVPRAVHLRHDSFTID